MKNFRKLCIYGNLDEAKSLYHSGIDIRYYDSDDSLFMFVCMFGHLDVAKWLYGISIKNNSPNINYKEAFILSCKCGHLEIAKWLYQLSIDTNEPLELDAINEAFFWCRSNEYEHVAIWLHETGFKLKFF